MEECGIRCAYHGWKFDVEGRCLEIPTLDLDTAERVKPKAAVRALEAREFGDVVWAWMGAGAAPELPRFEFATLPPEHRFVSKKFQQCNWAQACEGGLDTAHFSYLARRHAGRREGRPARGDGAPPRRGRQTSRRRSRAFRWMIEDGRPDFTVLEHPAGLLLCAARRADDGARYWRMTQFLMPNHSLAPGNFPEDNNLGNTWVPVDDESCWIFCYCWNPDRPLTEAEVERLENGSGIFAEVDERYMPVRRRENDYLIDRTLQREQSFTGIVGISEQDQAIADSQGRIADRTRELLGQTDLGVVRFRQLALQAVRDRAAGRIPKGADAPNAYHVRSGDAMGAPDDALRDVIDGRFGAMSGARRRLTGHAHAGARVGPSLHPDVVIRVHRVAVFEQLEARETRIARHLPRHLLVEAEGPEPGAVRRGHGGRHAHGHRESVQQRRHRVFGEVLLERREAADVRADPDAVVPEGGPDGADQVGGVRRVVDHVERRHEVEGRGRPAWVRPRGRPGARSPRCSRRDCGARWRARGWRCRNP